MSLKPTNRFTLEENSLDCSNIVDDLKTLYTAPDLRQLSEAEFQNALLGLFTLYQLKFEKLNHTFNQMVADGQIE